jgi:hypothetical protein
MVWSRLGFALLHFGRPKIALERCRFELALYLIGDIALEAGSWIEYRFGW